MSISTPSIAARNCDRSISNANPKLNWAFCRCFRCRLGSLSSSQKLGRAVALGHFRLTLFFFPQTRNAAPAAMNVQARSYAADAKASPTEVSSILEQRIRGVADEFNLAETGRVLSVGYVDLSRATFFRQRNIPEIASTSSPPVN